MPLTKEQKLQLLGILAEYSLSCAEAAKVAEMDVSCLPDGITKDFFEAEAKRMREEAATADCLYHAIMGEMRGVTE